MKSVGQQTDLLYFRWFHDPLSAFFPCQLTPSEGVGAGQTFRSAEHLYHFRRMKAHNNHQQQSKLKMHRLQPERRVFLRELSQPTLRIGLGMM